MLHPLMIGPKSSNTPSRTVRGKVGVTGNPPREVTLANVELFADQVSLGVLSQKPYVREFDTTAIPDGEHTFKAVGKDANGAEVWSATTKVIVKNTAVPGSPSKPFGGPPGPGPVIQPPPAIEPSGPPHVVGAPGIPSLDQFYTSPGYRLSIRYPASWIVQDQTTSMKPKLPGGFWLVFGAEPIGKSPLVVNLRRQKLEPTTDADTFARYNKYVLKWQRKTILGATAFATTAGTPASKRVTHRLILIKDGSAWMLNCIDTTGGPADKSRSLLDAMVNTLEVLPT
jgi:hypothetical protein